MRCCVICDAIRGAFLLSDRILIHTGFIKLNIAEYCKRIFFSSYCGCTFRHRSTFSNCRKFEREAICFAPVIEFLGGFEMHFCFFECVCNRQAFLTIICYSCDQFITLLFCLNDNLVWRCIICDTVNLTILFSNGVFICAFFFKQQLTPLRNLIVLCGYHCCFFRHWCIFCYCCQIKLEFCRIAPVFNSLCGLQGYCSGCVVICNN